MSCKLKLVNSRSCKKVSPNKWCAQSRKLARGNEGGPRITCHLPVEFAYMCYVLFLHTEVQKCTSSRTQLDGQLNENKTVKEVKQRKNMPHMYAYKHMHITHTHTNTHPPTQMYIPHHTHAYISTHINVRTHMYSTHRSWICLRMMQWCTSLSAQYLCVKNWARPDRPWKRGLTISPKNCECLTLHYSMWHSALLCVTYLCIE